MTQLQGRLQPSHRADQTAASAEKRREKVSLVTREPNDSTLGQVEAEPYTQPDRCHRREAPRRGELRYEPAS